MKTLLEWVAFLAILGTALFVAVKLWATAIERFCRRHGYRYLPIDAESEAKARTLIGEGNALEFVSGSKRGYSFLFCVRSWGTSTSRSHHSSNVLVDLRKRVPPLAIRDFGSQLPVTLTIDVPGIRIPDDGGFSARYHVSGSDGSELRSVLSSGVRTAFVASRASQLLSDGQTMLCTWPERPSWPTRIEALVERSVAVADALDASAVGAFADGAAVVAPSIVPPSPLRRIRFRSFLAGAILSVFGGLLCAAGGVFAVAAWLSGALDPGAPRGLIVLFAVSLAGAIGGPFLVVLGRRAFREKPLVEPGRPRMEEDAVAKAARRWARLLVRKQESGGVGSIDPTTAAMLRQFAPDGERSAALEALLHGGPIADLGQACRALVEFETGVTPADTERYARLRRVVDEELAAARSAAPEELR